MQSTQCILVNGMFLEAAASKSANGSRNGRAKREGKSLEQPMPLPAYIGSAQLKDD